MSKAFLKQNALPFLFLFRVVQFKINAELV